MVDKYEYVAIEDEIEKTLEFRIKYPKKINIPKYLYKYYSLKSISIDALKKSYLYATHPDEANDKYECGVELIDYSGVTQSLFVESLTNPIEIYSTETIKELYQSEETRWILQKALSERDRLMLSSKFGIISMTSNPLNIQMWAYYTNNKGFVAAFKQELLPKDIYGPFAVRYNKDLRKIDYMDNDFLLSVLYQTSVKHKGWSHEKEWRYLTYNPQGNYHPQYNKDDIDSRKVQYDETAIKEIYIGHDLLDFNDIDLKRRKPGFDIIKLNKRSKKHGHMLKYRLIKFLINKMIPTSIILRHQNKYKLGLSPIEFEQIEDSEFRIIYSKKVKFER